VSTGHPGAPPLRHAEKQAGSSKARQGEATNNTLGMLVMIVAMIALITSDSLVKLTSDNLPLGQILTIRGAIMLVLMFAIAWGFGYMRPLSCLRDKAFVLRIAGEMIAVLFYFMALFRMPLADTNAIVQFAPLATIMAAALLFGDKVGWRRWAAAIVGLLGVLLIIRPGSANFTPYAFLVLVAVAGVALRDIATREMNRDVPSLFVALVTGVAVTIMGLAIAPFETWHAPTSRDMLCLTIAGVAIIIAHTLMVVAVRVGELSVVAPFRFTKVVWGIVAGYLIWGHFPDSWAMLGFALVIGAGLYAFFRERKLERARAHA